MSKTIFVNGGAGFIGHHLCIALSKMGFEVIAIDNMQQLKFSTKNKFYRNFINERIDDLKMCNVDLLSLDTRDDSYLDLISEKKPDIIYHMSAIASAAICQKNPDWAFSDNLVSVERVLEHIRLTNLNIRVIFSSSSVVYGNFESDSVTEETPISPMNMYGLLKKNAEELLKLYNDMFGVNYTIIRPSALYGPRCVNRRVSQIMIENAIEGKPVFLYDGGEEKLDFTFVDDTVQGFVKAGINEKGKNQIFNITYGEGRKVKTLVEILEDFFPDLELRSKERDNTMPERGTLKIDKARKLLDYNPEYPLEVGYRKYIEWYLDRKGWFS